MTVNIRNTCPFCGRITFISVEREDFYNWQAGMLVQDAFPYLSTTEREVLISDICPECQEEIFKEV